MLTYLQSFLSLTNRSTANLEVPVLVIYSEGTMKIIPLLSFASPSPSFKTILALRIPYDQLVADMNDNLFANILFNTRTKQTVAIISDLIVTLCH